jgi:hypothetical protein
MGRARVAMAEKYWKRVRREARQDALRALGLESPERAVIRIVAAVVGIAFVWWATKGGSTADLIFRAIGAAAILALFPIIYIWKLVSVPSKMEAESRNTIEELTLKLDDRERRAAKQRALGKFIESGQQNGCLRIYWSQSSRDGNGRLGKGGAGVPRQYGSRLFFSVSQLGRHSERRIRH